MKIRNYIIKHKVIIILIIVTILRFLLSYNLSNYFISSMRYDDNLMKIYLENLNIGNYLGNYDNNILTKGMFFSLVLSLLKMFNIRYNIGLSLIYIMSSILFTLSLKENIKDKKYLAFIYIVLLFNPVSYSSELFQRLYRNSFSLIELLIFLSFIIKIINNRKNDIINYVLLGISLLFMFLTREDNIWALIIVIVLIIYDLYKHFKIKNVIICFIPFIILFIGLNLVSYINYKYYGLYTYNELSDSNFKNFYINLLKIKDDYKLERTSITKNSLYKLCNVSKTFGFNKEDIDGFYNDYSNGNEIENNDMIWYLRSFIFIKSEKRSAKDADFYYKKVSEEMDELFKEGKLEKEFVIPSVKFATPTLKDIIKLPIIFFKTVYYVSAYKDIKTAVINNSSILKNGNYNKNFYAYFINVDDRYNTHNIAEKNGIIYEIFRIIYKYLTIVLSGFSFLFFIKHIREKSKLNFILIILFLIYFLIIIGISYNDVTSFNSIRYLYLGNVYIIQNIFILLNMYRFLSHKLYIID